jgi:hypothetical protein
MPVKSLDYPVPIGVRVSRRQAAKLDAWAAQMGRQRATMIRFLIDHAQLSGIPTVRIAAGEQSTKAEEVSEPYAG